MDRKVISFGAVAFALLLSGCGTGNSGKAADCGYYQDSATVLLSAIFEAENTPLPTKTGVFGVSQVGGQERAAKVIKNKLLWSERILEAPECFPDKDIYKAREYQVKYQ